MLVYPQVYMGLGIFQDRPQPHLRAVLLIG